jgi:hypothetical protein
VRHTPGPWKIVPQGVKVGVTIENVALKTSVAFITQGLGAEGEANARLIGAAPFAPPHACADAECPGLHLFALLKTIAEDTGLGGIYQANARALLAKIEAAR